MYQVACQIKRGGVLRFDIPSLKDAVRYGLALRHLGHDVDIVDPATGEPVEMWREGIHD